MESIKVMEIEKIEAKIDSIYVNLTLRFIKIPGVSRNVLINEGGIRWVATPTTSLRINNYATVRVDQNYFLF